MAEKGWDKGRLLETSGWYWKSCTLHAGVKLDIFTVIGDAPLSIEEIASAIKGDQKGVGMLLHALAAMGLLKKEGTLFKNTEASQTFLSRTSPAYIGFMITHHHHLVDSWGKLDVAVTSGKPVRSRPSHEDTVWRENFLMGMFNIASGVAPRVAKEIDLRHRHHLLDLGGGPGTYAIYFCKENPKLKATVYDLHTTEPFAKKTIARYGMADRVSFLAGDYLAQDITGHYDVAWLSHILHGEGLEDCVNMIRKTVGVLESGGLIMIHDFVLDNTLDGPLFPALFALNMLLGTTEGKAYSEEQITGMLSRAGVREIRRLPFQGPNDSGIIVGSV